MCIASKPISTNQGFKNLICGSGVDNNFLYYLLQTKVSAMLELAIGSTFLEISKKALASIEIQLPPLPEQRRISEALSDTDALLAAMEKLIAKKRAVKQGTMQELLTGKRRLPGFKGEWMKKRVGAIGYTYSGLTGKNKEHFGTGEANYITFLNVLTNTIIDTSVLETVFVGEHENQNAVDAGDLFFNTSSETPEEVGMCAVLTKTVNNTYLNSFCFGFRLTDGDINGLFLSYYFNSNEGRKIMTLLAQGATRYNLSKSYFNDTVLTIPKLREQTVIAEILSDMDAEIDALTAKLNKLRNIKQGMMSELLTGHIRLTEQEAEASPEAVAAPKIIELPKCKATKHSETNGHGKAIEDAVILAVVTNLYATDQYPLAPFYAQKLPYLLHRHMEGIVRGFHKLAAGPYNAELKYKTALPIAKKNRYVITREEIYMGTTYQAILIGDNIDQAKDYFSQWHGEEPLKWLEQFKYIKNRRDELELLTTVDMAMVELRESGEHISLPAVKKIIQSGKEWAAKLKREIFSDTNITRAIKWSNKLFGMEGDSQ
jgi:type I restriction enzyme S subunit